MVATLLARHPNIFIPPETHFFRSFLRKAIEVSDRQKLIELFKHDRRLKDLDLPDDILNSIVNDKSFEITHLLTYSLGYLASRERKYMLGEKTPAHLLYSEDILAIYPNTKFIFVVRDGRDCVLSNIREPWTYRHPLKHAAEWNYYMECYKKLKRTHNHAVICTRYEDILGDTENETKKITEFIGETFNTSQLDANTETHVIPEWERNWKAKALRTIDSANIYNWKKHSDPKLIEKVTFIMRSNLDYFGYDPEAFGSLSIFYRTILYFRCFLFMPYIYPSAKWLASIGLFSPIRRNTKEHTLQ